MAVNQARQSLVQSLVVEAELAQALLPHVRDENIGSLEQAKKDSPPVWVRGVERNGPLAPVEIDERRPPPTGRRAQPRVSRLLRVVLSPHPVQSRVSSDSRF